MNTQYVSDDEEDQHDLSNERELFHEEVYDSLMNIKEEFRMNPLEHKISLVSYSEFMKFIVETGHINENSLKPYLKK